MYPHDINIEAGKALGPSGTLPILATLPLSARNVLVSFGRDHPLITVLLLQHTIGAMSSGTLYAIDAFYMTLGLSLLKIRHGMTRRAQDDLGRREESGMTMSRRR